MFVLDGITERAERWRRATEEERKAAKHLTVMTSPRHPAPSRWLSKLRYRMPIRTFFDGSAMGHVRKREWLEGRRARPRTEAM